MIRMAKKHVTARGGGKKESSITNALVDVAVEIGHAAEHVKSSMEHLRKAGEKGRNVSDPVQRAGKRAVAAVRKRLK